MEGQPVELEMIRLIVTPESEAAEQAHRVLRRAREETEPGSVRVGSSVGLERRTL